MSGSNNVFNTFPLNGLEFRRVNRVVYKPEDLLGYMIYTPMEHDPLNTKGVFCPLEEWKNEVSENGEPPSDWEIEHTHKPVYRRYYAFTTSVSLRDYAKGSVEQGCTVKSRWDGSGLYIDSNGARRFDVNTMRFIEMGGNSHFIQGPRMNVDIPKMQQPGDLIACARITVSNGQLPRAGWWSPVSEQFLKWWTSVFFPDHHSFKARAPKNSEDGITSCNSRLARRWLLSGNRLATNTFRKWVLANHNNGVMELNSDDVDTRYYYPRGEVCSYTQDFTLPVHFYAKLYVLYTLGEELTRSNLPQNLPRPNSDEVPLNMMEWDV